MLESPASAAIAADVVLVIHAAFVGFVVFGQAYVLLGWRLAWQSARNRWFRGLHLAAIGLVVLQAWIGMACPLTMLEYGLRHEAGGVTHEQSFIAHWLSRLIYYDLPTWVFVATYTAFGALVLICYLRFPPRSPDEKPGAAATRS